ncbi:tyrosine-type recombinase/integrase [Natrarchaeobius oligotrophus]|uniref:Recombinase XerD n=1 Tax=Natrarchaeobius chitinivorans TaxID=1679083 RepID=A0A3N6MYU5_NATCH|nr:site-specific integrase [Natrarchaeobius chitinivorans]RQH00257.1 recombinase XerD [Natrarchaeobius chitinivorans]
MSDVAIADAVDAYLQRKAVGDPDGPGAGSYASNAESILRRFATWAQREHGVESLRSLEADHARSYALDLRERADRGEYTASTARTYFAVVRAFLSWCVRGGIIPENPAATETAESALPSAPAESADDGWTDDRRRRLEAYVRDRALESTADGVDPDERRNRLREYALVAVLAHSGARGSELFRVPEDDRRSGATWADVDFYTGTIRVLGRSQRTEEVSLLARARTPLRRYRVVLDPPTNDWPLFPTRHAPSIAGHVRERLRERGHADDEIEAMFEDRTATELARERAIAPPAITTEGARSVLKRLCSDANVDVDGDYLTPRSVQGDSDDEVTRDEASGSKPALRTSVRERSIAVPVDLRSGTDSSAPEETGAESETN